ncbi:MAG: DinB family protein [Vicinamibacterales bacterium]
MADLTQVHKESDALRKAADDAAATRAPAEGGWTAAQIGYHVGLANLRLADTTVKRMDEAPPDFVEEQDVLKRVPDKVQTFEALQPPSEINKGAAIEKLDEGFSAVIETFRTLPEDRAQQIVKFPFGTLSMYQLGEFVVQHARRHVEQIRRALR